MDAPSMVQRSGDQFIVRSVVSGDQLFVEKDGGEKKPRRNKELSSAVDQKSTNATDSDGDTVNELIINEDELAEQDIDEEEDDDEAVEGGRVSPRCRTKTGSSSWPVCAGCCSTTTTQ